MPYKDKETQRAYQLEWMQKRRLNWLSDNGPCIDCGSWDDLEIDHVDANKKVTHRVWSWSDTRRSEELSKCVVRCHDCHVKKRKLCDEYSRGDAHGMAKLTPENIIEIRTRYANGEAQTSLAKEFNVDKTTVYKVVHRLRWTHI